MFFLSCVRTKVKTYFWLLVLVYIWAHAFTLFVQLHTTPLFHGICNTKHRITHIQILPAVSKWKICLTWDPWSPWGSHRGSRCPLLYSHRRSGTVRACRRSLPSHSESLWTVEGSCTKSLGANTTEQRLMREWKAGLLVTKTIKTFLRKKKYEPEHYLKNLQIVALAINSSLNWDTKMINNNNNNKIYKKPKLLFLTKINNTI